MTAVPSKQMQDYILTARRRSQNRLARLDQRRAAGLETARKVANVLRQNFGAERVVLFGSVLGDGFHATSDLDLAVWGLPESLYFKAIAQVDGLDGFTIDLVEAQFALPHITAAIQQGIEL